MLLIVLLQFQEHVAVGSILLATLETFKVVFTMKVVAITFFSEKWPTSGRPVAERASWHFLLLD